jgi:putative peptide zinc metalloprotease protein
MTASHRQASAVQAAAARLSLVAEGEDVLVGNPATATFVAVPAVGGVVLSALADGRSVAEAAAAAFEHSQVEVDVEDFLATLEEAGILVYEEGAALSGKVRWISGVPSWLIRPLFGKVAWSCYALAFLFVVVALAAEPALRPSFEDYLFLPDPMLSILCLYAMSLIIMIVHESWHWLAGRAIDVPARFRLSYRGAFLAAETDLSLLLTRPRRQRYGPMLAGPAFDINLLALAIGLRWAYFDLGLPLPDVVARMLGALTLMTVTNLVLQCAVFLRTDLYAVLACALRCDNLYRTSWLTMKARLLPVSAEESAELHSASRRDRSVAQWFSVLYLVGMFGVFWFLLTYIVPGAGGWLFWVVRNIQSLNTGSLAFWESVAAALLTTASTLAPLPLALRERRLRRLGRLA